MDLEQPPSMRAVRMMCMYPPTPALVSQQISLLRINAVANASMMGPVGELGLFQAARKAGKSIVDPLRNYMLLAYDQTVLPKVCG